MIIYNESCQKFISQCGIGVNQINDIASIVSKAMREKGISYFDESMVRSWQNSLPVVAKALKKGCFDNDIDVAIEYKINQSRDRIDFLIYGVDELNNKNVVVLELKQWSAASRSEKADFVHTFGGGGEKDYWHPSYQAYNYSNILLNFNEYINKNNVHLASCSYLHNMPEGNGVLFDDPELFPLVKTSPAFLEDDVDKLISFIKRYVKKSCHEILYEIEHSEIKPSKQLQNMLAGALNGNPFFSYDEAQATSVSTIVATVKDALKYHEKKTIIIRGGAGTGKSVVAINALGLLISPKGGKSYNAAYFTSNSAPRELYSEELIKDDYTKEAIKNLFKSPVVMAKAGENELDCAIIDEAHRIYDWKGGTGVKKGINLLDKLIYGSRVNVFFIDEDQAVTTSDYATIERIHKFADKNLSRVIEGEDLALKTEFRCHGGDNYISFIRTILGYEKLVTTYDGNKYDFRIFSSPSAMREEIRKLNWEFGKCRLVAGYDYEWVSKFDFASGGYDIVLENGKFQAKWNMRKDNYSWLNDINSIDEVGCIHTCQGLDMNYCGVIIGKDMTYRNGHIVFNKNMVAKSDRTSGIRSASDDLAAKLIRNTYNVLLTRGTQGTFVYCEDEALSDYFASFLP